MAGHADDQYFIASTAWKHHELHSKSLPPRTADITIMFK